MDQLQPLQDRQNFLVMELNARTDLVNENSPYNEEILKELKAINILINYFIA